MKIIRLSFFLVLFCLLAISHAHAFRPGPDIIRECPQCKKHLAQSTTMSGNTFGAVSWTDGKMNAPMLPERPWLVKCPECKTLFWIDEANEVERRLPGDDLGGNLFGLGPEVPTEEDYLNFLSTAKLPLEKELYVRQRAWWLANDAIRMTGNESISYSPVQEANLVALAQILDENDPDQCITKAEIFRELGRFEACMSLLSRPVEDAYRLKVAEFIRKLAEQKLRRVQEVNVE